MTKYVVTTVERDSPVTIKQTELIQSLPFEEDVFDNENGDTFFSSDDFEFSQLEVFKRGSYADCQQYIDSEIDEEIKPLFEIREENEQYA